MLSRPRDQNEIDRILNTSKRLITYEMTPGQRLEILNGVNTFLANRRNRNELNQILNVSLQLITLQMTSAERLQIINGVAALTLGQRNITFSPFSVILDKNSQQPPTQSSDEENKQISSRK